MYNRLLRIKWLDRVIPAGKLYA